MNTIHIEVGENTQKLLERIDHNLTELLRETRIASNTQELIRLALTNAGTPFPAAPVQPQNEPEPVAVVEPTPEPEQETAPWEQPPADQITVKLADVQKKVVDLSTAGKKDAVKAIIQAYAPKVSAIPEDKYGEVLEKLATLEG